MTNRKIQVRFFDVMDYEKEAQYLTDMHRKGWKFAYVTFPGLYHFTKCQPEQIRYQLDYNKDGIQHKEEYTQMFADCGWEYLFDFVGYSYFRKPECEDCGDEEIFCDDDSRFDMIKRIFKGRILPLIVIFLAFIVPMFLQLMHVIKTEHALPLVLTVEMALIAFLYISIFVRFTLKYIAFKEKMGR